MGRDELHRAESAMHDIRSEYTFSVVLAIVTIVVVVVVVYQGFPVPWETTPPLAPRVVLASYNE